MEISFNTLDYNSWKTLMTESGRNPRVLDVVTESNFEIFVQAHEAGQNGDYETAKKLRAEIGLNNGNEQRNGAEYGKHQQTGQGQRKGQGQKNNIKMNY